MKILDAAGVVPFPLVTAWAWLQRPDPEHVEAAETEDHARLLEERERLIRQKTAAATLSGASAPPQPRQSGCLSCFARPGIQEPVLYRVLQ